MRSKEKTTTKERKHTKTFGCKTTEVGLGRQFVRQWMEKVGLSTLTLGRCLISLSNPPAADSLIRSLEKNADLHIIKDYVEENNNSFGVLKQ